MASPRLLQPIRSSERDRVQRVRGHRRNSTSVTAQNMTDGLDWMIQQNSMSGPYQGKLDNERVRA